MKKIRYYDQKIKIIAIYNKKSNLMMKGLENNWYGCTRHLMMKTKINKGIPQEFLSFLTKPWIVDALPEFKSITQSGHSHHNNKTNALFKLLL